MQDPQPQYNRHGAKNSGSMQPFVHLDAGTYIPITSFRVVSFRHWWGKVPGHRVPLKPLEVPQTPQERERVTVSNSGVAGVVIDSRGHSRLCQCVKRFCSELNWTYCLCFLYYCCFYCRCSCCYRKLHKSIPIHISWVWDCNGAVCLCCNVCLYVCWVRDGRSLYLRELLRLVWEMLC